MTRHPPDPHANHASPNLACDLILEARQIDRDSVLLKSAASGREDSQGVEGNLKIGQSQKSCDG